jgi:transcriptional regulator with XRE-family HTH domain
MIGIGQMLKEARLQQGYSLEEMHEKTHISLDYLQALEEEQFSKLPSPFYARGFLRAYARSLRVDPQALLEKYEVHVMKREPQKPEKREMHSLQVRRQQSKDLSIRASSDGQDDETTMIPRRLVMAQKEKESQKKIWIWLGTLFFSAILLVGFYFMFYKLK